MTSSSWIALFAAIGLGTVVAAVLSRWSVISNHRQNWINALREDLAEYLKQVDATHYHVSKSDALTGQDAILKNLDEQQDSQNAALLVYRRILLRLNITEEQHIQLAESLEALLDEPGDFANPAHIKEVIGLARKVLKQEWAVTKYGAFAPMMLTLKSALKDMKGF